jgi:hypothetical protein
VLWPRSSRPGTSTLPWTHWRRCGRDRRVKGRCEGPDPTVGASRRRVKRRTGLLKSSPRSKARNAPTRRMTCSGQRYAITLVLIVLLTVILCRIVRLVRSVWRKIRVWNQCSGRPFYRRCNSGGFVGDLLVSIGWCARESASREGERALICLGCLAVIARGECVVRPTEESVKLRG